MDTAEFEMSPTAGLSTAPAMNAATERRLKWSELALRIEHYKYYLTRALHVTIFFYAITGGVLGFYLKGPAVFLLSQPVANAPSPANTPSEGDRREVQYRKQMEYFLLLPILMGSVLGGVFLYGARLQEDAVDTMEHLREDLRERLGLDVGELYDAQLLNILLRIFGYIYFSVAILLVILPRILNGTWPSVLFIVLTVGVLAIGGCLPLIAKGLNRILKFRRRKRMLERIESWRKQPPDFSNDKRPDLYYELRYYLGAETTANLVKETTESFDQKTESFQNKWTERKPQSYFPRRTHMTSNTQIHKPTEAAQLMVSPALPADPASGTKERKDLLLGMYQENRCHARHYEAVRVTVVSVTLAAAIGISAAIQSGGLNPKDWPLAVVLVVIGIYGALFTSSYFKRISCHEQLAAEFCDELDVLFGTDKAVEKPRTLKQIEASATAKHKQRFANWRDLKRGELFRMYWPITISILAVVVMLLKFSVGWII